MKKRIWIAGAVLVVAVGGSVTWANAEQFNSERSNPAAASDNAVVVPKGQCRTTMFANVDPAPNGPASPEAALVAAGVKTPLGDFTQAKDASDDPAQLVYDLYDDSGVKLDRLVIESFKVESKTVYYVVQGQRGQPCGGDTEALTP